MRDTAAVDLQIGLGKRGGTERLGAGGNDFVATLHDIIVVAVAQGIPACVRIGIVAVAAAIEAADEDTMRIVLLAFTFCSHRACTHTGAPGVVDGVLGGMRLLRLAALEDVGEFCRKFVHSGVAGAERLADGAGNVIATVDGVDEYHARTMFAVDVDECPAADVGHAGTAEDVLYTAGADGDLGVAARVAFVATTINVTANGNLGRKVQRTEKQSPKEEQPPKRIGSIGHVWFVRYIRHIMVSLLTL